MTWALPLCAITVSVGPALLPGTSGGWQYALGLVVAAAVYLSVLLHEFAHVVVAARFGIRANAVYLHLLGATAVFGQDLATARQELAVAAAGPAMSLLLVLAWGIPSLFAFSRGFEVAGQTCGLLAAANLWLALLNLLPAYPMDGGRILYAIIWAVTGKVDFGRQIATGIAVFIGTSGLCVWIWMARAGGMRYIMYALIGAFLLMHALNEALSRGQSSGIRGIEFTGDQRAHERDSTPESHTA